LHWDSTLLWARSNEERKNNVRSQVKGERKIKLVKALWRFEFACTAMDRAAATCDLVTAMIRDDDDPRYFPLIAAICVTYGKPFTANQGLGALPKEFEVLPNGELQHTHDVVIASRNHLYAHTDLKQMVAVDPALGKKKSIYKLILDIEDQPTRLGTNRVFGRGIIEPKLRAIVIPDIKELCIEQKRRCKKRADDCTGKLLTRQRVKPGRYVLDVGQQPW
jgi:hypothetical protein